LMPSEAISAAVKGVVMGQCDRGTRFIV